MFASLVMRGVYFCLFVIIGATGQMVFGPGKLSILSVDQCENDAEMPWRVRVIREKYNSTHDVYDVDATLLDDLSAEYGIRFSVCAMTNGSCEHIMDMKDKNMSRFLSFCNKEKMERALTAAGIDPPTLPIAQGEYHLENFLVNMDDMSKMGMYGEFVSQSYLVKDGQDLACVQVGSRFDPFESDS